MAILLAGGAGYIATHTCVELLKAGYEVVVADNFVNSKPLALDRVREITGADFPVVEADLADAAACDRVFRVHKIDGVVHFAGLKAVGESVSQPLRYYRNNLDTTLSLLEAMRRHGCHRFVFSSSATVYGIPERVPLVEGMPTGCTNPYGWTKYMNEQILTDAAAADPELSVVLLRYFNPIGAHPSGRIGEDPNGIPNNLLPFITQVAIGKRERLSIFGNDYPTPDGTGVRDYIHVVDLAKGHVAALRYAEAHTGTEIFNLGTGTGYSVLDIVHAFERVNHLTIPYVITDRRPGDVAACYADPSKAARVLGWRAELDLDAMCRDAWNWQRQNPNGYDEP